MLYIKTQINSQVEIKIDLYEDEIFTQCPACGVEQNVEKEILLHILQEGDFSSTSIYCRHCSVVHKGEGERKC